MTDFRKLSERVWASPQISAQDVAEASANGFAIIVNNRPDGESPDQPSGSQIESAARENGMAYRAIPVGHDGLSQTQVDAMRDVLDSSEGKVLAFCRSGTRSTFLWCLARARSGEQPDDLARAAAQAGYDVSPIIDTMTMRSSNKPDVE